MPRVTIWWCFGHQPSYCLIHTRVHACMHACSQFYYLSSFIVHRDTSMNWSTQFCVQWCCSKPVTSVPLWNFYRICALCVRFSPMSQSDISSTSTWHTPTCGSYIGRHHAHCVLGDSCYPPVKGEHAQPHLTVAIRAQPACFVFLWLAGRWGSWKHAIAHYTISILTYTTYTLGPLGVGGNCILIVTYLVRTTASISPFIIFFTLYYDTWLSLLPSYHPYQCLECSQTPNIIS